MAEDMDPAAAPVRALSGRVKPGRKHQRERVRYSPELGARICRRVAAGELLYAVCRSKGMPTPQSVGRWAREQPDFGAALAEARRTGGRGAGAGGKYGGGVFTFCDEVADEIFERLCEGESLTAIGRDPTMPCLSTIFYWRRRMPDFEEMVQRGVRIRAERVCDEGWEMACAATPETAYVTQVRLAHLRWMAGVMAPRVFRLKLVEPERPREPVNTLFRHFAVEVDPETGKKKVVAWCPNHLTGEVEREDAPGWRPPPGAGRLPGG